MLRTSHLEDKTEASEERREGIKGCINHGPNTAKESFVRRKLRQLDSLDSDGQMLSERKF